MDTAIEKKKIGRPSKYKPEYCQKIIEYFSREHYRTVTDITTYKDGTTNEKERDVANDLPLLCGFAASIDVVESTVWKWTQDYPEFSSALKKAKDLQKDMLVNNALNNRYNCVFSIFAAKNIIGWRDKQEVDLSKTETKNYNIRITTNGNGDGKHIDRNLFNDLWKNKEKTKTPE